MVRLFNFVKPTDLTGFTLLIPTVSVGNVPQLTVDLLITSMDFQKAATIWHPAVVSSVGADPYGTSPEEICTACELYVHEARKLALIQLRSTVEFKLATKFFRDLKNHLVELKIGKIVILTSSFDYELHIVSNHKFFYISNEEIGDLMQSLNIKPKAAEFNNKYLIHGSGFAVKLYETLKDRFECTVLIKYVSEGDNRPDAVSTVEILSKLVANIAEFNIKSLKFPSSWNYVFGGPPPLGIY